MTGFLERSGINIPALTAEAGTIFVATVVHKVSYFIGYCAI